MGMLRGEHSNPHTLTETRGSKRVSAARRGSSPVQARSRPPPSLGGPGPAGVPGSAGPAGGLRPQDPAEEPAEPGPGGLARRAQPLAHGPGAGAAPRAPRLAPSGPFYCRWTPKPRPGAERAGERPPPASRCAWPGPASPPAPPLSGLCPPARYTPSASARRSAFWTPLASLPAKITGLRGRPQLSLFLCETTARFIIMIPILQRFEFRKQTFLLSHPSLTNSSPRGSSVLFPRD